MRVLVTGARGMVGSYVVRELLEAGHEPIAFDVHAVADARYTTPDEVRSVVGDVLDVELLADLMGSVDTVAHLAGVLPAEADPYLGYRVNALGPVTVFEAAKRVGLQRVVWSSAKAAYGALSGSYGYPEYAPVPEDHPLSLLEWSPVYTASKIFAEQAARHFRSTSTVEIVGLRFATIFGPGKVRPMATGLFGATIAAGAGGEPVRAAQGADERDELIYVRDVARSVVAALVADDPRHDVYNIGSGILISLPELAAAVARVIGVPDVEIGPGLDPCGIGLMYGRLDDTRARLELGYAPAWDLDAALRDFAEHLLR